MSLTLYFHPLSSFCQKVLIALYENDTPFKGEIVDLMNETSRENFRKIWPVGKFPVLRDEAKGRTIPETSVIIEYLAHYYPGRTKFIPDDFDSTSRMRMRDRFYDLYVNVPMQKIVTDKLRPEGKNDSFGVEEARKQLRTALDLTEKDMADKTWAIGEVFSMADCAAAPPLFYANLVMPFRDTHTNVAAYLDRLLARASFARAVEEAKPYLKLMPK